jgi:hypothetical protein
MGGARPAGAESPVRGLIPSAGFPVSPFMAEAVASQGRRSAACSGFTLPGVRAVRDPLPRPGAAYSATISPEPPNSAGKSFSFGSPSRSGSTVSA